MDVCLLLWRWGVFLLFTSLELCSYALRRLHLCLHFFAQEEWRVMVRTTRFMYDKS